MQDTQSEQNRVGDELIDNQVKSGFFSSNQRLPLVLEPLNPEVKVATWIKKNLAFIETSLLKYGGVLFRGFDLDTQTDYKQSLRALGLKLIRYNEGATPRTDLGDKIYTSTEYPADQAIALHNELSYVTSWPGRITFFCSVAPEKGGETPLGDVRRVYEHIDPNIVQRFNQKGGWMLVRNFGDALSLNWQTSFHLTEKVKLEEYFQSADIEWEWQEGDWLRTRQVRPVTARHPKTGEWLWFNHVAFWHISNLESKVRQAMLTIYKEDKLPYNTYYGDGSPIEESVITELREAYRQETKTFSWQKGDLLLLDNMLVAHGRSAYSGARRILTAMGDPCNNRGL